MPRRKTDAMGRFDLNKAMEQITNCEVVVKIKRLEQYEIDMYSRPKKRNAKRRYDTLSFDLDDDRFFEMACEEPTYHTIRRTRRKRKKVDYDETSSDTSCPLEKSVPVEDLPKLKLSDEWVKVSEQPLAKVKLEAKSKQAETEIKPLRIKREYLAEPVAQPQPPARLRVKTAAELGSTIIFVDSVGKQYVPVPISFQSAFSSLANRANSLKLSDSPNVGNCSKLNIKVISRLYKKFFTPENQLRIRRVAEILQNVTENAEHNNERIQEINNSKCTDAEKLMLRCQAYGEHKRKLEANHAALKEQFEIIVQIFDNENFEILFQLFFLGILKIFLVSAPNKKGTLFKKIVSQLSSSLDSSGYKNDRVTSVLRAKQFRDECITLVQFIEKYSETEFFEMLFLSDSDKMRMTKKREPGTLDELPESGDKRNQAIRGSFISESNVGNLKIIPCGNHLMLPFSKPDAVSKQTIVINNNANNLIFHHLGDQSKKMGNVKQQCASITLTNPVNIIQQPRTLTVVTSRSNATTNAILRPGVQHVTVITSKSNTACLQQQQPMPVIQKANYIATGSGAQAPRSLAVRPTMNISVSSGSPLIKSNSNENQHAVLSPNVNIAVSSSSSLLSPKPALMVQQESDNQFGSNLIISTPSIGTLQANTIYLQHPPNNNQSLINVANQLPSNSTNHSPISSTNQTGSSSLPSRPVVVQPSNEGSYNPPRTGFISVRKDTDLMPPTSSTPPYQSNPGFLPFAPISSNTNILTSNSYSHQPVGTIDVTSKTNELNPTISSYQSGTNNENIMPSMLSSGYVKTKTPNGSTYVPLNSAANNLRSLLTDNSYFNQHGSPSEVPLVSRDQYFNSPIINLNAPMMNATNSAPSVGDNAIVQIANCTSQRNGAGAMYTSRKQGCDNKLCSNEATVICSGCNSAYYCGNECQKMDWAYGHNATCNMSS